MSQFITEHETRLHAFAVMSHTVGARSDYVQGGGGNTSVKLPGGLMAIKASGYCLSDITESNAYAVLDYQQLRDFYESHNLTDFEDVEKAGSAQAKSAVVVPEGLSPLRPSVEAGFHSLLDEFVIHSHSVYANLVACCAQGRSLLQSALKDADYSFGFVPYVDPGARLTFSIRDELARVEQETGKRPSVLCMQNHGVIVHSDDPRRALFLHEDANERFARFFHLTGTSFPAVSIRPQGEEFISATPYLTMRLKGDAYPDSMLLTQPLYPDQLVFFTGTLGQSALIQRETGLVHYRMPQKQAQTMEETLTAVVFITEQIQNSGRILSTMGDAAKAFIANWESEKYRKSLVGGAK